jgi:NTE family protein
MLQRRIALVPILCLFAFCAGLAPAGAQSMNLVFPAGDGFRAITEPVFLGEEKFLQRLAAVRAADGREALGLVLAGGSARAYAHIGMLQVLEAAGVHPDFIVANSMGAVIGMLYAAGISPESIAQIVAAVPLEDYFKIVLPTRGGVMNADAFVAIVSELAGGIDLSDTPIPVIITTEDLESRRQIRIAEGDFSKVMAAAFALPAIFEPINLDGYRLIDGGVTEIIPVAIARGFAPRLIISTALYDKSMNFDNPLNVLNRTIDIGKTRVGLGQLADAEAEGVAAFVVRNDVENISYMKFSDPGFIIERGRQSTLALLDGLEDWLPPGRIGQSLPGAVARARSVYAERIPEILSRVARGSLPDVETSLRLTLSGRLLTPMRPDLIDSGEGIVLGPSFDFAAGRTRASFAFLAGLDGDEDRQWEAALELAVNPFDSLRFDSAARVRGSFMPIEDYALAPAGLGAGAGLRWPLGDSALLLEPRLQAAMDWNFASGLVEWNAEGGIETAGRPSFLNGRLSGFGGLFAGSDAAGFHAGPSLVLSAELFPRAAFAQARTLQQASSTNANHSQAQAPANAGNHATHDKGGFSGFGLRTRLSGHLDLLGTGTGFLPGEVYRGALPSGRAPLGATASLELPWHAGILEFDAGEIVLVKGMEISPYLDLAWQSDLACDASASELVPASWTAGLSLATTISFVGLSPVDISLFAGLDASGSPVLGLKGGRLFDLPKR